MKVFNSSSSLQTALASLRLSEQRIALVPTMGNLHAGHLALVAQAKKNCHFVLTTIFVNPLQFGPNEDYERYPRTFEADRNSLIKAGCDAIFIPSTSEMYPSGLTNQTSVSVPSLSKLHCGESRPGHFSGVCTIVSKLFNLTNPDCAFFGEKDFQQLLIIKKMVTDLCMPIKVTGIPIEREPSGLAMSSRNSFLSETHRHTAANLFNTLCQAKKHILQYSSDHIHGQQSYKELEESCTRVLVQSGMQVDYFTVCNAHTLEPASKNDTELVILTAVFLDKTRLIDNIQLTITGNAN